MDGSFYLGGGDFVPGDRVQQVGIISLAPLDGLYRVVDVYPDGLVLAGPDGAPRRDLHDRPRHYPPERFRKVS